MALLHLLAFEPEEEPTLAESKLRENFGINFTNFTLFFCLDVGVVVVVVGVVGDFVLDGGC